MEIELLKWVEYFRNDLPKCPYCNYDINIDEHELYELYEEEISHILCPNCEKEMEVETITSYKFTTREIDE